MAKAASRKEPAHLTRRREDYLEAVFELVHSGGFARVRDIASRAHVSKSSVTAALKQLSQAGLVHYDPYEMVTLTDRGEALAEKIRGRHDTLRQFLEGVLDIDAETADANACRMEHVVDEEVLRRLAMLAEFVEQCPLHGGDWLDGFSAYCRRREGQAGPGRGAG